MQVKKQELELDMEQQTGAKLRKEQAKEKAESKAREKEGKKQSKSHEGSKGFDLVDSKNLKNAT